MVLLSGRLNAPSSRPQHTAAEDTAGAQACLWALASEIEDSAARAVYFDTTYLVRHEKIAKGRLSLRTGARNTFSTSWLILQTCCASQAAEPRTQFHENKRRAPAASAVVTAAALAAMDHQLYEGGAYHPQQQPVFLLDDDHDHWPVHQPVSAGAPAPASQAEPLPPLTGGGSANPAGAAAPMVPVDNLGELEDDEEATESENERGGGTRAMARLHHLPSAGYRPDSALTGASRQPSPSPSVNLHGGLTPAAQASAAPPRAQQAASSLPVPRGGSKGGGKARKPGGKGGITLRLLIEEGILQPGHNVLSVVRVARATYCHFAGWCCDAFCALPAAASGTQLSFEPSTLHNLLGCMTAVGLQGHETAGDAPGRRPYIQQHQRVNHDLRVTIGLQVSRSLVPSIW